MNAKMMWGKKWLCTLGVAMLAGTGAVQAQDNSDMDREAQALVNTLSEEKTEINTLAAQQAMFKKMGGRENMKLAAMWGRWIRDHKAGSPTLMRLTRKHGGDPMQAKIMKPPVLGSQEQMLNATHKDHEMAVMTSQMRYGMTSDPAVKRAMHKRANTARKHLRQMAPYHKMHHQMMQDGKMMSMNCPHCNVKMVNGKCPQCGMTMKQMKGDSMQDGKMMSMTCPHCNVKMVNGKCPDCGMTMQQMKSSM